MEAPFVGQDRRAIVDQLFAAFDEVAETGTPRWISLEGPSGWGKTRLIHEFYRRLADERQDAGDYWPATILEASQGADHGTVGERRKRIAPEQWNRPCEALPSWMWLGVSCVRRGDGQAFQALADDLTQIEAHQGALRDRFKADASVLRRARAAMRSDAAGEWVGVARDEALGVALDAAGLAVPGMGVILEAAKFGLRSIQRRLDDRDTRAPGDAVRMDATGGARGDLVDELAPAITSLSNEVVPVVVIVEDLHDADASLVEFLSRLLSQRAGRVLVVSTAWTGRLDAASHPAQQLWSQVATDRIERVVRDTVGELDEADRIAIAQHHLPDADPAVWAELVRRYTNPLAIELASTVGRLQRAIRRGTDAVEVVRSLPREVARLYEAMWDDLPEQVQLALMASVLASPAGVSTDLDDRAWDVEVVRAGVSAIPWLADELAELTGDLSTSATAYDWVRVVDAWVQRLHEPAQHELVSGFGHDELGTDVEPFYQALFDHTVDRLTEEVPLDRRLRNAELVRGLVLEGFVDRDERFTEATVVLCRHLASLPDYGSKRRLIDLVAGSGSTGNYYLAMMCAQAQADIGHHEEAVELAVQARDAAIADVGPLHPVALTFRHEVAHHKMTFGDPGALEELANLVVDRRQVSGVDDPATLSTELAWVRALGDSGAYAESAERGEDLVARAESALGADHAVTRTALNNLAVAWSESGDHSRALDTMQRIVDLHAASGAIESPAALLARTNLATQKAISGQVTAAIDDLGAVVESLERVRGPAHPQTLQARHSEAVHISSTGDRDDALARFAALIDDGAAALGPDAPILFASRWEYARLTSEAGHIDEALAWLTELLEDCRAHHGPGHPMSLHTAFLHTTLMARAGRHADAVTLAEPLIELSAQAYGPDHDRTLELRDRIGQWLAQSGRFDDGLSVEREVLVDARRVWGPDAPATWEVEHNVATILSWIGQSRSGHDALREAIATVRDVRERRAAAWGSAHPRTVAAHGSLATWLGWDDQLGAALAEYERLLEIVRAADGHSVRVCAVRRDRAVVLARLGNRSEAQSELEDALAWLTEHVGAEHPDSVQTRSLLDELAT